MKTASIILLCLIVLSTGNSIYGQCSTAGPRTAGSVSSNSGIGSVSWSGAANTTSSNNSYATASVILGSSSTVITNYMWASNFGFTIPTSAVICGVVVQVERNAGGLGIGSSISDHTIRLVQGGAIVGNNKASGSSWGGTDATISYGASNDSWGAAWTAADFNASNFGVVFAAQMSTGLLGLTLSTNVDYLAVTVHYQVLTPVGYKNLSATAISGGSVSIKWETTFEKDNDVFIVEKSNGGAWETLTRIKPASFNTNGAKYEVVDSYPASFNEYRIKQIDVNGRFTLSNVVSARVENPAFHITIAPNPTSGKLFLKWNSTITSITIHNEAGLLLRSIPVNINARNLVVSLAEFNRGLYYVRFFSNGETYTKTVAKL